MVVALDLGVVARRHVVGRRAGRVDEAAGLRLAEHLRGAREGAQRQRRRRRREQQRGREGAQGDAHGSHGTAHSCSSS